MTKERPTTKLPAPGDFGEYKLADGSVIYPSGRDFKHKESGTTVQTPSPGKWMLWCRRGNRKSQDGREFPDGEFVMCARGLIYFDTALEALEHLEQLWSRR